VLLYSYFEGEQGVPHIWDWEDNDNCHRFYHIYRRSGAKIVAASGHLEVKNCTKNLFAPGLRLEPLPKNPTAPRPSSLDPLFALPWKKNLRAPMRASLDQRGYSTLSPVNAGMGDPLGILPATQVNSAFRPYVVGK